ncbi:hypothetical protein ACKWTF_015826 [Chironomus riparius]
MKIKAFFVVFSTLFIINTSFTTKMLIKDQELPKSICSITNNVTKSTTITQDILIGNMDRKIWSSTANDIIKCLDDDKAVVATDLTNTIQNLRLRKASVIILMLNQLNEVRMKKL